MLTAARFRCIFKFQYLVIESQDLIREDLLGADAAGNQSIFENLCDRKLFVVCCCSSFQLSGDPPVFLCEKSRHSGLIGP